MKTLVMKSLKLCFIALVTVFLISLIFLPTQVIGQSMMPTLTNASVHLVNKLAYVGRSPKVNDVVLLVDEGELLMKRIVAVPGDTVRIHAGKLYINGELEKAYKAEPIPFQFEEQTLLSGQYFYIGDNRSNSTFGVAPKYSIKGKLVF